MARSVQESLARLRHDYRRHFRGASRWTSFSLVLLIALVGAQVARLGTSPARAAVAVVLLVALVLVIWWGRRERAEFGSQVGTIRRVLGPVDPLLASRAIRAAKLAGQAETGTQLGAPELARLHYERQLASASLDAIVVVARAQARKHASLSFALLIVGFCIVLLAPLRTFEGFNVLLARDGVAPVPWLWLEASHVVAAPPPYLRQPARALGLQSQTMLAQGSTITVKGRAVIDDRQLVLTDGQQEAAFVSDGNGGLVAHWTLEDSTTLRVASRYGDVLIPEPRQIELHSAVDRPPSVALKDAPQTLEIAEMTKLELHWAATDDHGLRQVDLVLRSGDLEERRNLAQFAGDTRAERGAHTLFPRDEFLRRTFLPVSVSIEARDANALETAEWGQSQAISLIPPDLGRPEADRMQALVQVRDALTTLFAWQDELLSLDDAEQRRKYWVDNRRRVEEVAQLTAQVLGKSYAGLSVPRGVQNFAIGQMDALRRSAERPKSAHEATTVALLALDEALKSLGVRDSQAVAKQLGEVAEQAARAAKLARETEQRSQALDRLNQAVDVLEVGAEQLLRLGPLGQDLGSITYAGLGRIARARALEDLFHTELAALHLAARLRRPTPSYSSAGGGGGVESGTGGGKSKRSTSGPASSANKDFDQIAQQLDELAREHGDLTDRVSQSLDDAQGSPNDKALRAEAGERASAIRDAVESLPNPGAPPGTTRADAALGREHAQGMAHALDNLDLEQAEESGQRALESLKEAQRKGGEPLLEETLKRAEQMLKENLAWTKNQLQKMENAARERARSSLEQAGQAENELSRRAEEILKQSRGSEAQLPERIEGQLEQAQSLMDEAARALSKGDGERALELQQQAQRLLERSDTGQTSDRTDPNELEPNKAEEEGGGRMIRTGGDVPDEKAGDAAAEFRRRVVEGLAKGRAGRLRSAVQRYAEGLLQ